MSPLVSYISQFMLLPPGYIISTATPLGVGLGKKPVSVYLKPGDVMRLGIVGLGEQTHTPVCATQVASIWPASDQI
jgi:2-keto-4-pentenoate hydratase/2-oxohepta-3-ene-1,7-dioic acid hydratase in catechol pathway